MANEPAGGGVVATVHSKTGGDTVDRFIADIEPFFYRRNVTYVDVGAFDGTVFTKFLGSRLAIGEAHLIEPNPESFARLKEVAQQAFSSRSLNLYNVAVGDRRTKVTMKAARSMTRVVGLTEDAVLEKDEASFEAECLTLDEMSDRFANGKISVLKVDVEGFEKNALAGAHRLFAENRVDVLYIEAGADPQGTQQCYYRDIDDIMLGHGYRMFRIYEQTNEWMEDSPLLRRMNIAYLSPRFAESHPYRLSREFFDTREALKTARSSLSAATKRADRLETANSKLKERGDHAASLSRARIAELREQIKTWKAEASAASKKVVAIERAEEKDKEKLSRSKTIWEGRLSKLHDRLSMREETVSRLEGEAAGLKQRLSESEETVSRLEGEAAGLKQRLSESEETVSRLEGEAVRLKQRLSESEETVSRLEGEAAGLKQRLLDGDEGAAALNVQNESLQNEIHEVRHALKALDDAGKKAELRWGQKLAQLQETLAHRDRRIAKLEEQRTRKSGEIKLLKNKIRSIYASTSWRLAAPVRFVSRKLKWLRPKRTKRSEPKGIAAPLQQEKAPTPVRKKVSTAAPASVVEVSQTQRMPAAVRKPAAQKQIAPAFVLESGSTAAEAPGVNAPKTEKLSTTGQSALTTKSAPTVKKVPLSNRVRQLEDRLWGGFSRYALAELEALKESSSYSTADIAAAARALASWYTAENDFQRGQENSALARSLSKSKTSTQHGLVEAYCLVRMGDGETARQVLSPLLLKYPDDPNVLLAMANSYLSSDESIEFDEVRLSWINRVYGKAGLLPLVKADPARPLTIENLTTREPEQVDHEARVSIIVPVYNAAETLALTLESIRRQSWRNIEVLIVDDCSTDATLSVAETFVASDPRFRLVRQDRNGGSYRARNKGLQFATGNFITIHDAGDWSHPQKIEIQARHLIENEGVLTNHVRWARAFDDLFFAGKFRRKDKIVDWNPSSVFFRRALLEKVGGWDGGVRISADAEFVRRIRLTAPGEGDSVVSAFDHAPLSFGIDTPSSLTKASATHGRTIYHGLRREYREASDHWHSQARPQDLRIDIDARIGPFPAPASILPDREIPILSDVLLIDDFNGSDAVRERMRDHVERARAAGRSIALFHWKRYDADPTEPLDAGVRQMACDGKVRIVAPGEAVCAKLLLVGSPSITQHLIDLVPQIEFAQLLVLDDCKEQGDAQAAENLRAVFASAGTRVASVEVDYSSLHKAKPSETPHE